MNLTVNSVNNKAALPPKRIDIAIFLNFTYLYMNN